MSRRFADGNNGMGIAALREIAQKLASLSGEFGGRSHVLEKFLLHAIPDARLLTEIISRRPALVTVFSRVPPCICFDAVPSPTGVALWPARLMVDS